MPRTAEANVIMSEVGEKRGRESVCGCVTLLCGYNWNSGACGAEAKLGGAQWPLL